MLTVVGAKGSKSFSLAELEALPPYIGYAGIKDSVGVITAPMQYTGVPLSALTSQVGGVDPAFGVTVLAKDGYGMTFSAAQAAGGGFTTYDPVTGAERPPATKLTRPDRLRAPGQAARPQRGRPAAPGVRRAQGRHGGRRPLVGALGRQGRGQEDARPVERLGPGGDALDPHAGLVCVVRLAGLPRQRLGRQSRQPLGGRAAVARGRLGRRRAHARQGRLQRALARKGYRIELIGANGVTTFLSSRDLLEHKDWILAGKVDGGELTPDDFPLRLVGPGLTDDESIGRITKVLLRFK